MTGYYTSDGRFVPVTAVQVGPCVVTQIKTEATDGYNALQLGFEEVKPSRVNKPVAGHLKKSGERVFKFLREFAVEDPAAYTLGQTLTVELFQVGQRVDVTGTTKGRGFAGVIKRHGFHGGPKTHGSDAQRIPGSIGASAWPSRVFKGKKLPGHYGHTRQTTKNLSIVDIRPESNLVLIKGALPGAVSGLLEIKKPKSAN
jgi:large subunit ribosomal protein L3